MKKKIKKKYKVNMTRLFSLVFGVLFVVSLFMGINALAETSAFKLMDVTIKEKSATTTGEITNISTDEVKDTVTFHQLNDYVTYKMTIKNNKDKEITIVSISDDNNNEYIEYLYDKHENEKINAGNTFDFLVKATYKKELEDISKRDQNTTVKFIINYLEDGEEKDDTIIINPDTNDNIIMSFVMLFVSTTGLVVCIVLDKKKRNKKLSKASMFIIIGLLLTPIIVKAAVFEYDLSLVSRYGLYDKEIVKYVVDGEEKQIINKYGEPITGLETPTKKGYTFTKWTYENEKDFDPTKPITEDTKIIANFSKDTYTISYDLAGGEVSKANPVEYTVTDEITLIEPTKENYDFIGWTGTGITTPTKNLIIKDEVGNKEYIANYEPTTYTITYKGLTNEEKTSLNNPTSYNIETGKTTLNNPQDRKDEDDNITERFVGWKDNDTTSIEVEIPNVNSMGDKTFEAIWLEEEYDTYTITYNLNGGVVSEENKTSFTKKTKTFTLNNPTKTGYTFKGWSGTDLIGDENKVVKVEKGTAKNLSFEAHYIANTYTIKYDKNGGTGSMSDQEMTYDIARKLSKNTYTKEGYTFKGWNTSADGNGTSYNDEAVVENLAVSGNITLYAKWEANSYEIVFNSNHANTEGTMPNLSMTYDTSKALTINAYTLSGYTFDGWNTKPDGTGTNYTNGETVNNLTTSGTITLYAKWKANTYTVVFDKNTGTGTMENQTITYDEATKFTKNAYTKEGYTFDGWNSESDGTGTDYADEEEVLNLATSGSVTLFAKWLKTDADKVAVTYHYGDVTFNGGNYIDTNLKLFSEDYFDVANEKYRDFEINFTINSYTPNSGQDKNRNVFASCMDEAKKNHYTGFDFRYLTDQKYYEMATNSNRTNDVTSTTTKNKISYDVPGYPWDINIKRTDTELYMNDILNMDYINIIGNFNIPLTFGAETSDKGSIYRYTKGDVSNITTKVKYEKEEEITLPTPTQTDYIFVEWNTKADGTGQAYTTITPTSDIDLYAIWKPFVVDGYNVTYKYGNKSFDGTNYLDTKLKLFSDDLYQNNFEIKTTINNFKILQDQNEDLNSIITNMNENDSVYPGFVYRYGLTGNKAGLQLIANSASGNKMIIKDLNINDPIDIKRETRKLYLNDSLVIDYIDFTKKFDGSLLFGTAMDKTNQPFRYSKEDLNNIEVTVQYAKGNELTLPTPEFINSGCTFTGWTGSNGTTPELNVTIPADNTEDKEYTANFACEGYAITFNANGGEVDESSRTIDRGQKIGILPTPTREGYTFDGWYLGLDSATPIDENYVPTDNITLIAKWTINQYTITFNTDGGSAVSPITQDYDTVITPPENPTKDGYNFIRWNSSIPAKMPAENLEITAEWESVAASNYLVTYQYGNMTFTGSNYLNTNLQLFNEENYDVANHNYKDFTIDFTVADFNTSNADKTTLVQCENEADKTDYPGFVYRYRTSGKKMNFVTYDTGGSSASGNVNFEENNHPINVTIQRNDNVMSINGQATTSDFDKIKANWTSPLAFGAGYDGGNINKPYRWFKGELDDIEVSLYYNNSNSVTLPNPFKYNDECVFTGWTGEGITTPSKTVTIPSGNTTNKTYTANYNCESSTVTFNPNGGSVSPTTKAVRPEEKIGSLPTPTRKGYTFDGWYLGLNSATPIDENYVPTGNITLTAKWTINQYTITFNTDGGSAVSPITQDYDTVITPPENPTKENFIFERWNPTIPTKMPANDLEITAEWRSVDTTNYSVTYNYGNIEFDGTEHLNTKLQLFSESLVHNDFEMSLDILSSEFVTGQSNNFNSLISAMDESGNPYPGFVFRRNASQYSFVANANSTNTKSVTYNKAPTSINIKRESDKLYVDGEEYLDLTDLAKTFNSPLSIGASLDKNERPFRFIKGELGSVNVRIVLKNDKDYTLPTPVYENSDCTFIGWTGSNGETPETTVTIPKDNKDSKTYYPNFSCTSNTVSFNANGGVVSETKRSVEKEQAIGTLPIPTKTGYIFDGWHLGLIDGIEIDENYVPTGKVTLYAKWMKTANTITIEESELNITTGSTKQINITDIADLGEEIEFISTDTSIATVDNNGLVTAVSEGETTITIKGLTTAFYQTIEVYVSDDADVVAFNVVNPAVKNYLTNVVSWDTDKDSFLASMQNNFESHNCKMNSDSSIKYADGNVLCDKPKGYDTKVGGEVKVYLYDLDTKTRGAEVTYTNSSSGIISNMIPGETYYWESATDSTKNGYVKALGQRRLIDAGVIRNVRDLGGLPVDTDNDGTIDGSLKYGKIFRGERLRTDQSSVDILTNLGVDREIVVSGTGELGSDIQLSDRRVDTIVHYQIDYDTYRTNYNKARTAVVNAMNDIIDGKDIYFHCVYGSDRTGTLGYLLEGLLGVPDEDRYEDYELSVFFGEVDRNRYFETDIKSTLPKFVYMKGIIPTTESIYEWFMKGSTNQTADQELINNFRQAMINYN